MSSSEMAPLQRPSTTRRFAVSWRNRSKPLVAPVATLDADSSGYQFSYLPGVGEAVEGFRPFIGFPDLDRLYHSTTLWPFFDVRVMDRKRPDFLSYIRWLGLGPGAQKLDILSRSGEQKGDTVSVTEAPSVHPDGFCESVFLIRGSRFASPADTRDPAVAKVASGDELFLANDISNEANSAALQVTTYSGVPIGWVPDLLIEFARRLLPENRTLKLLQHNGDAPWHMRLLAKLSGYVDPATLFFSDDQLARRLIGKIDGSAL